MKSVILERNTIEVKMAKEKTEKTIKEKLAEASDKVSDLYSIGGTQSLFNAVNGIVDDKSIYQQKMDFLLKVLANENSTPQIVLDIAKVQEIKLKLNTFMLTTS